MNAWWTALRESFALGGPVLVVLAGVNSALLALLLLRGLALRRGFREDTSHRLAHWRREMPHRQQRSRTALDETLRAVANAWTERRSITPAVRALRAGRHAFARYHRPIRSLAIVAPLLGLLGTVSGMVRTFEALGAHGGGTDIDALAGGIAEALITTEAGLITAVAGLLGGRALDQLAARRHHDLDVVEQILRAELHAAPLSEGGAPC